MLKHIKSRAVLSYQNFLLQPSFQGSRGSSVSVISRGILGQLLTHLQPDHIIGAHIIVEALLRWGDNIIRGTDHQGEIRYSLRIIAKTAKRLNFEHSISPYQV
jgi:hypothetical protein